MRRFFHVSLMVFAVLALGFVGTAMAQPGGPGGPGGRGPGGGMPMFGGEQASLSMLYGILLRSPTVQKDLDLVEDQEAKLKEANEKAQAAMRELFSGLRDLSREERQQKMNEMREKMQAQTEEMKKTIEGILLPSQLQRLRGIAVQVAGIQSLHDKDMQKELKLSDEQIEKLKSIAEDARKKMRDLFSPDADRQQMFQKLQDLRKDSEKQMNDLLTEEQKAAFEKLKGEKLEIPPSEMWGGFGGRRGAPRENAPRID